jgi:hypothetical protein
MDETVINGKPSKIVMFGNAYMSLVSFEELSETSSIVRLKILEHKKGFLDGIATPKY